MLDLSGNVITIIGAQSLVKTARNNNIVSHVLYWCIAFLNIIIYHRLSNRFIHYATTLTIKTYIMCRMMMIDLSSKYLIRRRSCRNIRNFLKRYRTDSILNLKIKTTVNMFPRNLRKKNRNSYQHYVCVYQRDIITNDELCSFLW